MGNVFLKPAVRRYIYGVATALIALLGVYGIVSGEQIAALTVVASAVTGLAFIHTDISGDKTTEKPAEPEELPDDPADIDFNKVYRPKHRGNV